MSLPAVQSYHRGHYVLLVAAACIACAIASPFSSVSVDAYWHIALGREWWQSGLSPWIDHYSFTFAGTTLRAVPYLFELKLAALSQWFDPVSATLAYKVAVGCLIFIFAGAWFYALRMPTSVAAALLAIIVVTLQIRLMARPELLSYAFIVVLFMLMRGASQSMQDSGFAPRPMCAITILMLLWSNYHTPVFGYVLLFGFFVDAGVTRWRRRQESKSSQFRFWLQWSGWGLLVLLVGFVTPNAGHPLFALITFDPEWKNLITEYERSVVFASLPVVYVLLAVAALVLWQVVRARAYGAMVVWTICMYNALLTARLVVPVGIIMVCLCAQFVSRSEYRLKRSLTLSAVVVVLCLWSGVRVASSWTSYDAQLAFVQPVDVVKHMRANNIRGRTFNSYETGAYLLYALGPDANVYIDGRTDILYPVQHYKRYQQALRQVASLRALIIDDNIELALIRNTDTGRWLANRTGQLQLEFLDAGFMLWRQKGQSARLARLGRWYAEPACVIAEAAVDVEDELVFARESLAPDLSFQQFRKAVEAYRQHGRVLQTHTGAGAAMPDPLARLTAYAAIDAEQWPGAAQALRQVRNVQLFDLLALAYSQLHAGQTGAAEDTMLGATGVRWSDVTLQEFQMTKYLIDDLQARNAGTRLDPQFVRDLDQALRQHGVPALSGPLNARHFCTGAQH